jgi:hypothetical protein
MLRIDVHADDPARMDADDVRAQAHRRCWLDQDSFGLATDLEEAHSHRSGRDGVVDHEGHVRVDADVSVLRRGVHVEPGDVDGAELSVVGETDRLVLRCAVEADGSQSPAGLAGQITLRCLVECRQITSNVLPMTLRASIAR